MMIIKRDMRRASYFLCVANECIPELPENFRVEE